MSFGSENPELSAFVVNTLYYEFTRYYRSMRSERSVENVGTFEALVNQKKTELDQKIDALRNYKSSEGLLNVEAASGNELGLISQLEKALLDEKATYNNLNSSVQSVNEQLAQMNQGKAVFDNNNSDIITLRKQLNQSNEEYQRGGSTDAQLADKIKVQRAQLQRLMSSSSVATGKTVSKDELLQKKASLDADLKASILNIASLQNKIGSLRGSVGSYANKEATVSTLQKEVDLAQEEYNKLKEKLNTALDSRLAPPDDFRQTLKGQPAFKPESSKRIIIMGMAGASVFLLTTLGVLFMEFFDSSIKSPSVFERHVDLKLISTINHADLHRYSIPEVLQKQFSDDDASRKRQNTFRELLRKLRYEVESSNKSIFLFTSTESQQGKTTLVQALAYSLSLSNKRVLIIDTNFCNNDLTVALQAKPTLETFSMEPEEVSIEKVREIVTTYSVEGIEVIGCKGGDYTPSEILPRNHLLNYLPQLKGYYDFVLLEGAPLNDYTDSKELVHYVEGVIAIFSSRVSLKQNDQESIQFLKSMNGKLLGAVLNNVSDDFLEL
jgi:Mrp family chromosome partitioning ATPase/exonuclease VII small subunit